MNLPEISLFNSVAYGKHIPNTCILNDDHRVGISKSEWEKKMGENKMGEKNLNSNVLVTN